MKYLHLSLIGICILLIGPNWVDADSDSGSGSDSSDSSDSNSGEKSKNKKHKKYNQPIYPYYYPNPYMPMPYPSPYYGSGNMSPNQQQPVAYPNAIGQYPYQPYPYQPNPYQPMYPAGQPNVGNPNGQGATDTPYAVGGQPPTQPGSSSSVINHSLNVNKEYKEDGHHTSQTGS